MMLLFPIAFIALVGGNLLPIQDEYFHKRSLSRCLIRAVNCCISEGEVVSVAISSYEPQANSMVPFEYILLEDLSKTEKVSYMVKNARNKRIYGGRREHVGAYIIHMRANLADLIDSLTLLSVEEDFNPHAKFFLVSTYKFENFRTVAKQIANIVWNMRLVNVVGLFTHEEKSGIYGVYIAHLYGKCGYSIAPHLIDFCTDGQTIEGSDWFDDKIPKNLNGCELQVRTSVIEPFVMPAESSSAGNFKFTDGLEIKLLNTIGEYLNLTINYTLTQSSDVYGRFYANSSMSGSYLDLRNKEIDLIVGYVVSRPETQQIFDTIASYFQDSLVFCVAHAKPLQHWIKVSRVMFGSAVFVQIVAYFFLSRIVYWSSRFRPEESPLYKTYWSVSLRVLKILFGISEEHPPRTSLNRFLILLGIISSFFYRSAYITYSTKSLLSSEWAYQIHTEEEIWRTKTIQYYPLCPNYFDSQELAKIKCELCDDYVKCLNRTALSEEYATCMPKLNVQYLFRKFLDDEGSPLLYYLNRDIVTYPIEMLMWKGHPLKPRINVLVNRLSAGGFIYRWEKDIFDDLLLNTKIKNFVPSEKIVLTFSHIALLFGLVVIWHTISVLVFIGEIILYRRKNRKQIVNRIGVNI